MGEVPGEDRVTGRPSICEDLRFKHTFTCLLSGPSSSGKSSFCISFLQNLESLCTLDTFDGGVIWCYSKKSAETYRQLDVTKFFLFKEGVPAYFGKAKNKQCPIILDVVLNEAYSKYVCHLFTKGSHHRDISAILIIQILFHQRRYCRDISLNAKYLVVLKNQFYHLAKQVNPEDSDGLYKTYLHATERPHSYLFLHLSQDMDDRHRFRTCISHSKNHPRYTQISKMKRKK